jgi:pyridoxamine 5'-phosphate oxidase
MNESASIIANLRREYVSEPLTEEVVLGDPFAQFRFWFDEALRAEQPDPEAMTLSTATRDGAVSARIVLLKGFDSDGFVFFTNYQSRKGRELIENPRAALTFYWYTLNRQVRIEGTAEQVSPAESEEYFATRPRGSQIGAWTSPQSEEIPDRETLVRKLAEMEVRFGEDPIPCPLFWGGFRLRPDFLEFWQGRENRLHDRIVYKRVDWVREPPPTDNNPHRPHWQISRLAP